MSQKSIGRIYMLKDLKYDLFIYKFRLNILIKEIYPRILKIVLTWKKNTTENKFLERS